MQEYKSLRKNEARLTPTEKIRMDELMKIISS